jgi:uncharacterized membrane protein
MPGSTPLSARLRVIVLATHALLLLALPLAAGGAGVLLALPLLAPARGLWRAQPYTYAWASMLVVFYVGAFLMEASMDAARRPVALALAVIAAVEFMALMLFVRFRAVEARREFNGVRVD